MINWDKPIECDQCAIERLGFNDDRVWVRIKEGDVTTLDYKVNRDTGKPLSRYLDRGYDVRNKLSVEERAASIITDYLCHRGMAEKTLLQQLKEAGLLKED